MVVVCGRIVEIERVATKTVYQLEDTSGRLEVVQWVEEGAQGTEHSEGDDVKVRCRCSLAWN